MEIYFLDNDIEEFIESLQAATIAKVLRTIDLLEKFGQKLGMPHSKPLREGLFELRIRGIQEVRMIYMFHKRGIVILHGFIKKTQKLPMRELKRAIQKKKEIDNI